jgi:hypothetical protein
MGDGDGGDEGFVTPNQSHVYGGGTPNSRRYVVGNWWALFWAIAAEGLASMAVDYVICFG